MRLARKSQFISLLAVTCCLVLVAATPGQSTETGPETSVTSLIPGATKLDLQTVIVIDRSDIELTGMRNLWDLLSGRSGFNYFGIYRPLSLSGYPLYAAGGYRITILINGRRISDSVYDLDALPVAAVERIEILRGSAIGPHGPQAVTGAINIVLRNRFEGIETEVGVERPSGTGGDTEQASVIWGGPVGDGHLVLGVDVFQRDEIRRSQRDFSRASWTPGGSFADAAGVSIAGNTALVAREGAKSLGDCKGSAYAGPLLNPYGLPGEACGFAWADIEWSWERRDRQTLFATFEHPAGENKALYADTRVGTGGYIAPYAAPTADRIVLSAGNRVDLPGGTVVFHRYAGHGDRSFRTDVEEYDFTVGVKGQFGSGISYDAHLRSYYHDERTVGGAFVRTSTVLEELGPDGHYDLKNPLSMDPGHLAAVRRTGIQLDHSDLTKYRAARVVVDGDGMELGGGAARWATGVEYVYEGRSWLPVYRDVNGSVIEDQSDIAGILTISSEGERDRLSEFLEIVLPVRNNIEVALAARHDRHDDVGSAFSGQIKGGYRLNKNLLFRCSWTEAEKAPFLAGINAGAVPVTRPVWDP